MTPRLDEAQPAARVEREVREALEIAAPPEAVWRAFTDAEELARWFPLQARVSPGEGGAIWLSWGESSWEGELALELWEPPRKLRARDAMPAPAGTDAPPMPLVLEVELEGRGGSTIVRLVQSGFRADADWEREAFEDVARGWAFELRSLRLYLERHAGETRRVAWLRIPHELPREEAWRRLLGPRGLVAAGRLPEIEGASFAVTAATGERLEGVVELARPPEVLALRVANLGDSLLRLELYRNEAWVWLSGWGAEAGDVAAFERRWRRQAEVALS